MTKSELRSCYKIKRAHLSAEQIETYSLQISNLLLKLPIWNYSFYHIFLSITSQKEVQTDYILNILSGKDKHIVISKSDFTSCALTHYLLTDSTVIRLNSYQIPEPDNGIQINDGQIDVVFVPLLAFDKLGNRVGYGKGFYDRFLSKCKPDVIKIGLSFFEAVSTPISSVSTDVTLDYCVTPTRIYEFNK